VILSRRVAWVSTIVVLLAIALLTAVLSACGQPDPVSRSASPSPTTAGLKSAWTAVGRLQVPLVDTVVVNSPGFTTAEHTYLVRSNVAWATIQHACSDYGTQPSSPGADKEKVLALIIDDTTSLWLKMKAPSSRFAAFHKQTQGLMGQLQELSRLTRRHALTTDEQMGADLAGKVAAASSPVAAMADQVAVKSEVLRDKFGRSPVVSVAHGPLTAAEAAQIIAIMQGSVWITDPLAEANSLLSTPMPSWSSGTVATFCLDMGFIQSECDNWINTPPAGPTIAPYYGEYVTGLRILREAAGELITAATNLDQDAAMSGAAHINEAAPHVSNAVAGFRALLPSAF
jgi:hypothetical protein